MIKSRTRAPYVEVSHPEAGMKVSSACISAYCLIRDKGRMRGIANTD